MEVKAVSTIALGSGRVDQDGFEPNVCNVRLSGQAIRPMYLTKLVEFVESFSKDYERLFGRELKYHIRLHKSDGEHTAYVEFEE